jgi:8-oxo-dGTP diphosphatase
MIDVTCAVIRNDNNEILIVQRGEFTDHPLKWEFPGGKIRAGETEEECVVREVEEELSIDVVICGRLPDVVHDYGFKKVRLIPFICDTLDEKPLLSEHNAFRWINPSELRDIDFSEADIFVSNRYMESISEGGKIISEEPENAQQPVVSDAELQSMINKMLGLKEAEWVAMSAGENKLILSKLVEYSYSTDDRLAFRASWILTKVCDKYPELLHPYLNKLVKDLDTIKNESTIRSFLRIISLSNMSMIGKHEHGLLADFCFRNLNTGLSAIAVKAYSMEILYKLTLIYTELCNELASTISAIMEDGPPGIKARGRMILRKLAENPIKPGSSQ